MGDAPPPIRLEEQVPAKYAKWIASLIFLLPTSLVADQPAISPGEVPANVLAGRPAQMAWIADQQ